VALGLGIVLLILSLGVNVLAFAGGAAARRVL
jgi:hypothetical protein